MTNGLMKAEEGIQFAARTWAGWLAPNLFVLSGLLILGIVNFAFHAHYSLVIGGLPSGFAFGVVLLLGPRALPAVILGTAGTLLELADPVSAIAFGFASGAACIVAWALVQFGKPIDFERQTAGGMGRLLLAGGLAYGFAAFLLGPYVVSPMMEHARLAEAKLTDSAPTPMSERPQKVSGHDQSAHAFLHPVPSTVPGIANTPDARREAHTGTDQNHVMGGGGALGSLLTEPIGILMITPAVLYFRNWRNNLRKARLENYRGAMAMLAVLVGVALSIYSGYIEDTFGIVHTTLLILPPAVWLALEFDLVYTLIGNIAVHFISGIGTSLGHGPFSDHTSGLPLLTVAFSLTTLLVAASRIERKTAEETIHRLARQDPLTGISNRSCFTERLERALYGAQRYKRKLALMFIDLDHFKKVNDIHGHQVGDLLLIEVARRIQACVRDDSTLARFGGDEFVILVDHVQDDAALTVVAERIAQTVSTPFEILGHVCHVACSVGISIYPDHGGNGDDLLKKADLAMYAVKTGGCNGFRFYSPEMYGNTNINRREHGA